MAETPETTETPSADERGRAPEPEPQAPEPSAAGLLGRADPDEARSTPVRREEIQMIGEPRGPIAEQFRSLRNSIIALNPDGAPRTVVLTSAVEGEGKTVSTLNLAIALAELPGIQVLVIDGDLHAPAVEDYLGVTRCQGLADVLRGACAIDAAIRPTSIDQVALMGSGTLPGNPSKLLGSDRMRTVLNSLKQRYSYVLIDTPAAMSISDASLLGAIADGIVLVVRLESTPRPFVEQTLNDLEAMGGNVLGTCLTGARPR
ncbi:MAG: CpsD/CapB family tyrosine-protein kinase [Planctomycetota bacterium]|jgi:capsular exopolysaccharide synthesis family protein|nr:CpsD/CapB family tyrosine-protein kinase [Planctomycetota bacterium]MDP6762108.1 CpsD/CapB family tyrosine-protein kinase [Planctomycetota bacterium]MDP6989097.1 CpsD/CapB family tyrosine-protein kinase [Planctomycetota bacterium]